MAYVGGYLFFRILISLLVGQWGLKESAVWKQMLLFLIWDATAFVIWLFSFGRNRIRWRNVDYKIRDGRFVLVSPVGAENSSD